MVDRTLATLLFGVALTALGVGAMMLIFGWIEWLQTGRWHGLSVLQLGYDLHLIKARWFLSAEWSWPIHDVLQQIPVTLTLIGIAPLAWYLGTRFARR